MRVCECARVCMQVYAHLRVKQALQEVRTRVFISEGAWMCVCVFKRASLATYVRLSYYVFSPVGTLVCMRVKHLET